MSFPCRIFFLNAENFGESPDELFIGVLNEERRKLYDRTADAQARREILYSHALVGYAYRRLSGALSDSLDILQTANGKPYAGNVPGFCFSISHSKGSIAVCVCDENVGVDIERIRPIGVGLAHRVFSAGEADYFERSDDKIRAFLEVWTRKECIVKYEDSRLADIAIKDSFSRRWKRLIRSTEHKGHIVTVCCGKQSDFPITDIRINDLIDDLRGL